MISGLMFQKKLMKCFNFFFEDDVTFKPKPLYRILGEKIKVEIFSALFKKLFTIIVTILQPELISWKRLSLQVALST